VEIEARRLKGELSEVVTTDNNNSRFAQSSAFKLDIIRFSVMPSARA
jgi:hypothetical protein